MAHNIAQEIKILIGLWTRSQDANIELKRKVERQQWVIDAQSRRIAELLDGNER